jgi:hypothetical protein
MSITAIKLSYGAGALADALIGVLLLFPYALTVVLGLAEPPTGIAVRIASVMTASLLFGWAALLLWGAHSPLERRGILPLTIFPVIAGLAAAVFLGWKEGYISTAGATQVWIMQAFLSTVFVYAFLAAGRIRRGLS